MQAYHDEFYRALCSSETLRSGKKGFFHDFSESVTRTAGDTWTSRIFGRIDDDAGRVRAVFGDARIRDVVVDTLAKVKPLFRDKDADISKRRRLEGYQLAAVGQYDKALLLFSQAVLRAPQLDENKTVDQGMSLPLALLGRAEVFMALKEHHFALEDLRLAAEYDLPDKSMQELRQRREECESFLRANEKSLMPLDPENKIDEATRLILNKQKGSGMSVLSMVAFRMVTQEGLRKCLKIYEKLEKSGSEKAATPLTTTTSSSETPDAKSSANSRSARRRLRRRKLQESRRGECGIESKSEETEEDTKESHESDATAYNLVTHANKRTEKDFLERTLMAAFLLRCLQRVGFFASPTSDDEVPGAEEIIVAALLLRNLQLLQFNAHEFFETRLSAEHRFRGSRPVYLGVAIYPTVARFNHDCYPAVTRYFVGRHIVIRAVRGLRAGDVIAENYGPIFTKMTLAQRQRTLWGRYWFRCTCRACQEDWPHFENLTNDSVRLRCPTAGCSRLHSRAQQPIKCPGCRKKICLEERLACLQECETLYTRGLASMEDERVDEAIETLRAALKRFHQIACPPHRDTHLAEIALSSCLIDRGNTWRPAVL
ncbi:uncharacterized protein LOC114937764 isoform X5 [Nylanderia fulva]|uniref:uncharacterized protein LOC114937764 isoform X5 n=1 Tax=Nylanderia fulva TaxID=613905 RepID=UPI0010FB3BA3|nr:uncharacterized protein LOC114937764 isoform X5 [Nylanderia fulva]